MAGRGPDERLGRLAHLDRGEVKARPSGFPEERPERRNATSGASAARVPLKRHAGKDALRLLRLTGAPLPHGSEKKRRRRPSANRHPGPMKHVCMSDDARRALSRSPAALLWRERKQGAPMAANGNSEQKILDWLGTQHGAMLKLLETLVNTDSGSYDKPGVDAV